MKIFLTRAGSLLQALLQTFSKTAKKVHFSKKKFKSSVKITLAIQNWPSSLLLFSDLFGKIFSFTCFEHLKSCSLADFAANWPAKNAINSKQ